MTTSASPPLPPESRGDGSSRTVPRLVVEGIRKAYRPFLGAKEVVALEDLSFRIEPGEVVGLLGPNGAGKTTTLMLCLGLLRPDRGNIQLFGRDPRRPASKTRVGFMPEESYFYRFFSTPEILRFYGRLFGLSGKTLGERIPALIERVGLTHAGKRRLRTFSKGMLRRVGLAQALINSPDLVILDEPTAGMDPIGTREVKDLIVELKREGRAVLLSSHLLADVEDVCDRIILLHRGSLVCQGEVADILSRTAETSVDFADLTPEALEEVTRVAESHGARVTRAEPPRESLEEFFVRTIGQREPKA